MFKTRWKQPAVPRHVVQMIPVDQTGCVLVMHRGPNVRSAKNVWSFPSGMHDIGESIDQTCKRELMEEYALPCSKTRWLGVYENVAGDPPGPDVEQYHWVITLVAAMIDCPVSAAVNKEPDKHDEMKIVSCKDLTSEFFDQHVFHKSFDEFVRTRLEFIRGELRMAALLIPRN